MHVFGFPLESPQAIVNGAVSDLAAIARMARDAPAQLERIQRAIEMASPLEGAIDRVGRLVDRLPGGPGRRTAAQIEADARDIIAERETTGAPDGLAQVDTDGLEQVDTDGLDQVDPEVLNHVDREGLDQVDG
jgi:ABC-type microcin C transport system permease subunit YejB